mmetsp:Transcript_2672/g.9693  ORF Transcript_2672/g.9693 Transcript_2672/m.9693 type:complete len:262 (-) Transcript_2672:2512-3297(-)
MGMVGPSECWRVDCTLELAAGALDACPPREMGITLPGLTGKLRARALWASSCAKFISRARSLISYRVLTVTRRSFSERACMRASSDTLAGSAELSEVTRTRWSRWHSSTRSMMASWVTSSALSTRIAISISFSSVTRWYTREGSRPPRMSTFFSTAWSAAANWSSSLNLRSASSRFLRAASSASACERARLSRLCCRARRLAKPRKAPWMTAAARFCFSSMPRSLRVRLRASAPRIHLLIHAMAARVLRYWLRCALPRAAA